jgi:hypothetical protein
MTNRLKVGLLTESPPRRGGAKRRGGAIRYTTTHPRAFRPLPLRGGDSPAIVFLTSHRASQRCWVLLWICFAIWTLTRHASANGIDSAEFRNRRQAYAARAADGVTVLFNTLEEDLREFVTDKDFSYLTGSAIPDAILVLSAQGDPFYSGARFRPGKMDRSPEGAWR